MPKSTETRGTLTRATLAKVAYARCSTLSRAEAQEILEVILEEVRQALSNGESVKLRSFGTFKIRAKRERPGRNPRTGDHALISPRKVVTFKASPILITRMNTDAAYQLDD
jgi:integration host factor subunit alpha